jgi:hypothetical protein
MIKESIWPVFYKGNLWYEKDCDELYVSMYEFREQLSYNSGIYLTEGICIFPDGSYGNYWD